MKFENVLLCDISKNKNKGEEMLKAIKINENSQYALFESFDLMKPVGNVESVVEESKTCLRGTVNLIAGIKTCGFVAPVFKLDMKDKKGVGELMYFGLTLNHADEGMKPLKDYEETK